MKQIYFSTFIILLLSNIPYIIFGQDLTSEEIEQIDALFQQYNDNHSPGYAIGVVRGGNLVFSKSYGYANLDYDIPLSDSSVFYIGSMAKQFTAAALLILKQQGKLDFNQEVQYYLSDFPIYDKPITINHLIHHTSGIRETNSLQLFQGINPQFEEVFDTDDLYELIIHQKELNFLPDEQYRYSSGGYAVLAKIVEQISGQTFPDFLDENIFQVLGMSNTFVSDNHNEIIKNRVVSYVKKEENQFERRSLVFDAYGDGGVMTTVNDLAQWDKAFYEDLLGIENFAKKMYQTTQLSNGQEIDYALALQVQEYRGEKMITHNGGMLGFRVDLVRFPDSELSIIILGNLSNLWSTYDAQKIADILLKDTFENYTQPEKEEVYSVQKQSQDVSQLAGYYWTDETNYFRRISFQNDSLFLDSGNLNYKQYLLPIGENEYVVADYESTFYLKFTPEQFAQELTMSVGSITRQFRKYEVGEPSDLSDLTKFEGSYKSEELQISYHFFEDNDAFFCQITDNKPFQIFPALPKSKVVWNSKNMLWVGFGEIKFQENQDGKVTGFQIGDSRVSAVSFQKK